VGIELVYETHSTTLDNEASIATGWLPGQLSPEGLRQAGEVGSRRGGTVDAVFASDLRRAVQTVSVAFGKAGVPTFLDWRLRECDYGTLNGAPATQVHALRSQHLDEPYPGGESWRQAVHRVGGVLDDLHQRWASARILVIGHLATRWALEHLINEVPLEQLVRDEFRWQPGWSYHLESA